MEPKDVSQITDSEKSAYLVRALEGTDYAVFYQDLDLRGVWIENPPQDWAFDIAGKTDFDLLPEKTAHETTAVKREVIRTGENARMELQIDAPNGTRWFKVWVDADFDENGKVKGILCFSAETTETKRRELAQQELLREVSHRSRNLLAIIQSIANQTAKSQHSITDYLSRFNDRLRSLAKTLDVVTRRNWEGATLHQVITGQVGSFVSAPNNFELEGVDPALTPNAALHIGLAIQELASNAAAHGAWSNKCQGSVSVVAAMTSDEQLELSWKEKIPGPFTLEDSRRFGAKTLLAVVPSSMQGKAETFEEDGHLIYRLTVPTGSFQ